MKNNKFYRFINQNRINLLYPSLDDALAAKAHLFDLSNNVTNENGFLRLAKQTAKYWSDQLKTSVTLTEPKDMFFLVERPGKIYWHIIVNNKMGWTIIPDDSVMEEVDLENPNPFMKK